MASGKYNVRPRSVRRVFGQFCHDHFSGSGRKVKLKLPLTGTVIRTRGNAVRISDRLNVKAAFAVGFLVPAGL